MRLRHKHHPPTRFERSIRIVGLSIKRHHRKIDQLEFIVIFIRAKDFVAQHLSGEIGRFVQSCF